MNKKINKVTKKILNKIDIYSLYLISNLLKVEKKGKDIKKFILDNININYNKLLKEGLYIYPSINNKELYNIHLTPFKYNTIQINNNNMVIITNFSLKLYNKINFLPFIITYSNIK